MGKTYTIQCLLNELGVKGIHSLVIDYTDGFLPDQLEETTTRMLSPEQHIVRQSPLPINPFKKYSQYLGGVPMEDNPIRIAKRVASILSTVYNLKEQQFSVIYDAIVDGIGDHNERFDLDQLLLTLNGFVDDGIHLQDPVQTSISKIKPFVHEKPFSAGVQKLDWDVLFKTSESLCNIFQLASLDPHTKQLVVEFVLWDLFAFARANGSKNDPKVIVLDEVQNLDHGEEGPLAKFLTEGRKFGICAILATQTICNLKKEHQSRLFQAGHKLFFKPAETEIREYAKILNSISLDSVNGWAKCLNLLKKGECISIGLHSPQKIKISSLESREGTPPSSPGG